MAIFRGSDARGCPVLRAQGLSPDAVARNRSGPQRHRAAITASRRPMNHHPVVESRDRLASRADEEPGDQCMDEARQRGGQQRDPESEGVALMLQIRLSHRARMVEE